MREIRFRAWSIEKQKWFYFGIKNVPSWVEKTEVDQFTGLNDKNGTPIYEGDIVKSESSYNKVFWDGDGWGFEVMKRHSKNGGWIIGYKNKGLTIAAKHGEVIGNIYENSELIQS